MKYRMINESDRQELLRRRLAELEAEHFLQVLITIECDEDTAEHQQAQRSVTAIEQRILRLFPDAAALPETGDTAAPSSSPEWPPGDQSGDLGESGEPPAATRPLNGATVSPGG